MHVYSVLMWRPRNCRDNRLSTTSSGADPGGFLRWGGVDLIILSYFTYSDRQAWANSIYSDQMPRNAASYQGLHCLLLLANLPTFTGGGKIIEEKYKEMCPKFVTFIQTFR